MKKANGFSLKNAVRTIFKKDTHFSQGYYSSYINAPGKAVWSGREYGKFSDEGYVKNVVAHRCISLLASGAANLEFGLRRVVASGKKISDHPLIRLLKRPNPCAGAKEFFEAVYAYKLISGNSYMQAVRADSGEPQELFSLRPDRVSVIAGKGCVPEGYRYTVGDWTRDFVVNRLTGQSDVLHLKKFNPLNDWYGLSSIEAAAYSIDQHNEAAAWNQALLQNGARPSGALIVKNGANGEGGYLSEDQYLRVKAQMDEAHTGAGNAGRPLLLEGGLEWKEMSISPKDMDFINTKDSAARDIAMAFGVPSQLLGIQGDATYNNMAEARKALMEQSIVPMAENMASELNNWLVPMFGGGVELFVDL